MLYKRSSFVGKLSGVKFKFGTASQVDLFSLVEVDAIKKFLL